MQNRPIRQPAGPVQMHGQPAFGRRQEPSFITVSRNGRVHHFAVHPLVAAFAFGVLCMFAIGYFSATAYLMLRDDLIGMAHARNARLLHEYEDRIATLRANLDRVTSRQLLDQQAIESRVAELMKRQEMLGGRSSRIGKLLDEAQAFGLAPDVGSETAAPQEKPAAEKPLTTGSIAPTVSPAGATANSVKFAGFDLRGTEATSLAQTADMFALASLDVSDAVETSSMFETITQKIEMVDKSQRSLIDELRRRADDRTARIAEALRGLKIAAPDKATSAMGGPYVPLGPGIAFEAHVDALDKSLEAFGRHRDMLDRLPVANPAPGAPLSSGFGVRTDPFLGTPAMHSGLDFKAAYGAPVLAAADGKVVDAGRNGGYGNMVEIDHGNGVTTRYAHLSRISVAAGDIVQRGDKLGEVGSTGRSTGPHLHYEVRSRGDAMDPIRFIRAGEELPADLL
jgi:murein DD-endopeptidase MepM/ murein hydrolase activator NlpD